MTRPRRACEQRMRPRWEAAALRYRRTETPSVDTLEALAASQQPLDTHA